MIPTPSLGIGSTMVGQDSAILVYVPEGEFTMGANYQPSDLYGSPSFSDNQPQHTVTLDAFWIDQTEVTNRQYTECVSAGECAPPVSIKSRTRSSYYGNPEFDNYPVIFVDWNKATTYCSWAGRRLPTEAEWEKAARGEDAFIYPWGNEAPNDSLLNYNSPVRDTTEVGKYPNGKSIYGAYDMAGNVWEWANDWFGSFYYQNSPASNPLGPTSGETRVLRGGSWYFEDGSLRSIFRYGVIPVDYLVRSDLRSWSVPAYENISQYGIPPLAFGTVGFRCAYSQ
jgi:formylglycine-generating enzyme required for sulfatase activity